MVLWLNELRNKLFTKKFRPNSSVIMTSEGEAMKTNEFLRRRKLRLQQVREQSKDIAKLIRQRAAVEKLKQVVELDATKEKAFFQQQENVVKKLEEFYSKALENVGSSHVGASALEADDVIQKTDLAQLRGKEATAELRRKKQQTLNEHKKFLDRKVKAREAANVISREKSVSTANKLSTKTSISKLDDEGKPGSKSTSVNKSISDNEVFACESGNKDLNDKITRNDMTTQWDAEIFPCEWEANIPALSLPQDDTTKDNASIGTEKHKRTDLFALSDEMPLSLRGIHHDEKESSKPSLTLVTEYIQNRALRLREPEVTNHGKKQSEEFKSLKQTIQRTRPANQAKASSIAERLPKDGDVGSGPSKKKSVTLYNHSTRDTRHVPFAAEPVVARDTPSSKDAYSEALNETALSNNQEKQKKNVLDMTNKIAMTRQHVEQEYKDTMAFLNALPKNKSCKPLDKAYKDEHRLQMQSESRQRILQEEFRKVEKECHHAKGCTTKSALRSSSRPQKCQSPSNANDDNFKDRDFQYSWMPVPEGDINLAVHTIPTAVKEGKTGGSVKFSKIDSYHEYRSRHKHTPPTKDTNHDKKNKRYVEALIIQHENDNSKSRSSGTSDDDSTEHMGLHLNENQNTNNNNNVHRDVTDAERIIVYKILDYKNKKGEKSSKKLKTDHADQVSTQVDNEKHLTTRGDLETKTQQQKRKVSISVADAKTLHSEDLEEGIYEIDRAKEDNIASMYCGDSSHEHTNIKTDKAKISSPCKGDTSDRQSREDQHSSRDGSKDCHQSRKPYDKCGGGPKSSNPTPALNSCLATSTTSFRTAMNVKLDSTQAQGECVKLIDEGGKEKGNIYVGASGLLRDDAYEVVIQLRKRGIKGSDDNCEGVINNPEHTGNIENKLVSSVETTEALSQNSEPLDTENTDHAQTTQSKEEPFTDSNRCPKPENNENVDHPKCSKNKDTFPSEKLTVVDAPNTSLSLKAATSVYTQTTCSLNPPPAPAHMSSSTSTAYMSPPEVILPKYLRTSRDSSQKHCKCFNRRLKDEQQPNCEVFSKCTCRHCAKYTKFYYKKIQSLERNRSKTPPNTARGDDTEAEYNSFNVCNDMNNMSHSSPASSFSYDTFKHKGNSKMHRNGKKSQPVLLGKRNTKTSLRYSKKRKGYNTACKKASKSHLHPMIKDYINKLLSLNQEGIKAIQVMNQECSEVNTPADSVLNIPSNVYRNKSVDNLLSGKFSLDEIGNILRKKIFGDAFFYNFGKHTSSEDFKLRHFVPNHMKSLGRKSKKRKAHKVKSLNISKKIICMSSYDSNINESSICFPKRNNNKKGTLKDHIKSRSHNLPSKDPIDNHDEFIRNETGRKSSSNYHNKKGSISNETQVQKPRNKVARDGRSSGQPKTTVSSGSTSPERPPVNNIIKRNRPLHPINSSTQTIRTIDNEINLMKLAEDKLQNMEKIANLTEKCTKRLSNLAKVLNEVRKNKSLIYSPISNSDSTDYDVKSDEVLVADKNEKQSANSACELIEKIMELKSPSTPSKNGKVDTTDYEAIMLNISNATSAELPDTMDSDEVTCTPQILPSGTPNADFRINNTKSRSKPPPALLRIHLKRTQETVIPHELSTVIEVDSPMSVKLKNQSSNIDNASQSRNMAEKKKENDGVNEQQINTVLPRSSLGLANKSDAIKMISNDTSDDSKLRMMDLNQFNEIMLRPFISLREYAQECYTDDVMAKRERDIDSKDNVVTEDVSSLHSDGSLPDVVAELLKRKLITEPFKFDSVSNVNSTTVSSESSSLLALSRGRDDKRRQKIVENKENLTETSDTLSISSNPDLENAFKKLGMGWASSTLKKTKERLALSSSSNTSSTSLSQFKFKNAPKQDMPTIVTDSVSSVPNLPMKSAPQRKAGTPKHVEQQTSFTNSMTVKEFLTKELAKKITFTNKSSRNETNEEFISLLESKMPDELKTTGQAMLGESGDAAPGAGNRARTSTPVQIFKSVTYHSSSSSNISNGLFSNADELSSVKLTSTSMRHHSTSEKDELTIPNFSLKMRKGLSDCSKTDSY